MAVTRIAGGVATSVLVCLVLGNGGTATTRAHGRGTEFVYATELAPGEGWMPEPHPATVPDGPAISGPSAWPEVPAPASGTRTVRVATVECYFWGGFDDPSYQAQIGYSAVIKDPNGQVIAQDLGTQHKSSIVGWLVGDFTVDGTYVCEVDWYVDWQYIGTGADPEFITQCPGDRATLIKEYEDRACTPLPGCSDFRQDVPTQSHYAFAIWNEDNTVTSQWAILTDWLTGNLYCIISDHGVVRTLTSGYRNPSNNPSGGLHQWGLAADVDTPNHPDDEVYEELRALAKGGACGDGCVEPRSLAPNHFHVDFRSRRGMSCPSGW